VSAVAAKLEHPSSDFAFGSATFSHKGRRQGGGATTTEVGEGCSTAKKRSAEDWSAAVESVAFYPCGRRWIDASASRRMRGERWRRKAGIIARLTLLSEKRAVSVSFSIRDTFSL
jgi:hypothetical protein